MESLVSVISVVSVIPIVFYPLINFLKSAPEKELEAYNLKLFKRIIFELFIAVGVAIQMFRIPKLVVIETVNVSSFWLIIPIGISVILFTLINEESIIKSVDKYISKMSIELKRKTKIGLLLLYLVSSCFLIVSLNNELLAALKIDLINASNQVPTFISVYDLINSLSISTNSLNIGKSSWINLFALLLFYNLIIYFLVRSTAIPFLNLYFQNFTHKKYCTLKLKDGSIYRDYEYISRDNKYFIIKKEKKYQAIFVSNDEIVYVQLMSKL